MPSTHRADALPNSYTLYILHSENMVRKLRCLLNSGEITDTLKARLQTLLAETEHELRSLP
jgi:hypothetical protein